LNDGANPRYEVYTREHVAALADYLRKQRGRSVLELGAGSGELSARLRTLLGAGVRLTATDSGLRGLHLSSPFEVELLDADSALATVDADIVITCWMPLGVDWTQRIRATTSVREYILIGEPALCGHAFLTWGECLDDTESEPTPQLQLDGWERIDLHHMDAVQLCRTDERWAERGRSRTVSFRRGNPS
jgi:hypothetical protein